MRLFEPDHRPGPLLQAISHYSFQLVFFAAGLFFCWRAFTGALLTTASFFSAWR